MTESRQRCRRQEFIKAGEWFVVHAALRSPAYFDEALSQEIA